MNISKFGAIPDKPFHSSGYAEVANGGSIGSTNGQTFGQRYRMDQNRQAIRKYRDSYIGQGASRDQTRSTPRGSPLRRSAPIRHTRQGQNSQGSLRPISNPAPRAAFREPSGRGYNPYG